MYVPSQGQPVCTYTACSGRSRASKHRCPSIGNTTHFLSFLSFNKVTFKFHLEEQTSEKTSDFSTPSVLPSLKESKKQWKRVALPGIKTNPKATILKQYDAG